MHQFIKDIMHSNKATYLKEEQLNKLIEDIEFARDILKNKYTYCKECDDYYLTQSFFRTTEEKEEKVCVYEDPINSGGNDYELRKMIYTYSVCPKNHKKVITEIENKIDW